MTTPRRAPSATDLLVALGTGAVMIAAFVAAPAILGDHEAPTLDAAGWWTTVAVLGVQAFLLCVVRLAPSTVLVSIAAAAMLLGLVVPSGIANLADAAVLVAVLRATPLISSRRLRVVLPLAGVMVAVGQAADVVGSGSLPLAAAIGSGVLQAIAIVGLPAVGVLAVFARRDARVARTGESAAMEREREALVQAVVARERTGMARELHDIAAHHVSGIAVMAAAIERQIDTDPGQAKRSVRQVREQSRALLDDLRRLVGLLRDADHVDAVETVDAIRGLVAEARATGRAVELRIVGEGDGGGAGAPGAEGHSVDASGVGPLGQLVAYRMVQESLANAALHAPGAASVVELDARPNRLVVTVRNDVTESHPSATREGFGLLGMRERAALVGGSVTAGPDADGGWMVRLELPSEAVSAPSPAPQPAPQPAVMPAPPLTEEPPL